MRSTGARASTSGVTGEMNACIFPACQTRCVAALAIRPLLPLRGRDQIDPSELSECGRVGSNRGYPCLREGGAGLYLPTRTIGRRPLSITASPGWAPKADPTQFTTATSVPLSTITACSAKTNIPLIEIPADVERWSLGVLQAATNEDGEGIARTEGFKSYPMAAAAPLHPGHRLVRAYRH
jgi:hypothetical protein